MQTRGEIISEVRKGFNAVNADNKTLTNKQIWAVIKRHLRWLIKRESDKMQILRYDSLFQTLKCVEVIEAPAIDSCCGIKSKCTVYRTKYKIPKVFESKNGVILKSVFSIDGSADFSQITVQDYLRKLENPHSKYDKSIYYYYNNGYLYFPKEFIRMIMVKGYFEEEQEVNDFNTCDTTEVNPCKSKLEENARIPDGLIGELMKYVMSDILPSMQIQEDGMIDKQIKNK